MRAESEDLAVSTAVGVILMVAVVLVLAAVVGGLALDIGDERQEDSVNAGVSFSKHGPEVTLNVVSTGNAEALEVKGFDDAGEVESSAWNVSDPGTLELSGDDLRVGATAKFTPPEAVAFGDTLTVVGHRGDDTQVVREYEVHDP